MATSKQWVEERSSVLLLASTICTLHAVATVPRAQVLQHVFVRNVRFVALPLGVLYAGEQTIKRLGGGQDDVYNSLASMPLAITALGWHQGWKRAVKRGAVWGGLSLALGATMYYGSILEQQQQKAQAEQSAKA